MAFSLDKIGWKDEPSTDTPIDSGNLGKMEENTEKFVNKKTDGVSIYDNSSGTSENFKISQDLSDINRIRVHYKGKNSAFPEEINCIKELPVINGSVYSSLEAYYYGADNTWLMRAQISISGTNVNLINSIVNIIGEYPSTNRNPSIFVTKIEIL